MNLSEAAQSALLAATSSTQGAMVTGGTADAVLELKEAKLVGPGFCLTRKGSIERERIMTARLDAAF